MKKIESFVVYWMPCIVWLSAIFYFSSRPHFGITEKNLIDFIIFKLLHMIEYGFLQYLLFRALHKTTALSTSRQLSVALIVSIVYAITDEVHQHFVPTREGKIRDIIIDMGGIFVVWFYIKSHLKFVIKHLL